MKIWILALILIPSLIALERPPLLLAERITAERALGLLSQAPRDGVFSGIYKRVRTKEDFQEYMEAKGSEDLLDMSYAPMKLVYGFRKDEPRFILIRTFVEIGPGVSLRFPDANIDYYALSFWIDDQGCANSIDRFNSIIAVHDIKESKNDHISMKYSIATSQLEILKDLYKNKTEPNCGASTHCPQIEERE